MKKYLYILLISLSIIVVFLLYKPETKEKYVLDCSKGKGYCEYKIIEYNITNCKKYTSECEKTKKGLDKVSYISDGGNYIDSPFTQLQFSVEYIDVELNFPWDLEFLPDGSMLVTEKIGNIIHIRNSLPRKVYSLDTIPICKSGLLGLAIDPEYEKNNYVYISYTYDYDYSESKFKNKKKCGKRVLNRVSRLEYINGFFTNETVLIDKIPGILYHSGSRLDFGPDGKLYVTTGDAREWSLSQKKDFLGGKILRLNKDGTIPTDNPFSDSYVYSMGHRNPQGIAWDRINNIMYASEHGPVRHDEINRILPGNNYGWGSYKCDKRNDPHRKKSKPIGGIVTPPVICLTDWTMGPSGIEFVSDINSPWKSSLFVSSLRGKHLHRYQFDGDKVVKDEIFFVTEGKDYIDTAKQLKMDNQIRDVEYYKGSLYLIGNAYGIVKISPK